ncbi:MAG: PLP-dependent aspartate aminotransferase family protein [Bacteroidia bacterium]|nr:PLP-dependent aspartate aminotransferase family protein [Bacteroidia bacterium]
MNIETILAHLAEDRARYEGAVVPPIFQNSLFTFESWEAIDKAFDDRYESFIYTRGRNPSVDMAEQKIAALAGGERALLFASGMAAISAAVLHYVKAGDHIITVKNVYGPANNLLNSYLREKINLETTFVKGVSVAEFEAAIRPQTKLIYLESPSSAVFSLQDIEGVVELAKKHGIPTMIDNSWATPLYQKPLEMGVDLEVHSCTKYICGHSDVVAGVVIGREKDIKEIYMREFQFIGGKTSPFEAWLLMRSLRTLPMRMRAHQENALKVARFLENHPKIASVTYPGLESHPQYALGKKQMTGNSGLLGFRLATEDLAQIKAFVNALSLFKIGVSWGGHESLIYVPAISYLKEVAPEQFQAMGISLGDMRISVGLEHPDDLINDLETALAKVGEA